MSYCLEKGETLEAGIRRVAREEVELAAFALADSDDLHEAVHDARERMKKVRALLRLVRDELGPDRYRSENVQFRDLGRRLADIRDAHVSVQTLDALELYYAHELAADAFSGVRGRLLERRDDLARRHLARERRHERVAEALEGSLSRIDEWPLGEDSFDTIAPGLRRVYGRGRARRDDVYGDGGLGRLHEWRKRVKYLWYHVRILQGSWPGVLGGLADSLHDLSDLIGESHDLSVLANRLARTPSLAPRCTERAALTSLCTTRRDELRELARPLGLRIWHEAPGRFVARLGAYWAAWRLEPPGSASGSGDAAVSTTD